MAARDTQKSEKVKLDRDDTFTIVHQGATLKLKLNAADRSVELLSIDAPGASGGEVSLTSTALLRKMTSPKITLDAFLLKKLGAAGTVVLTNVTGEPFDVDVTLPSLAKLSKEMVQRGGSKPLVVLKVPHKRSATVASGLEKTLRTFQGTKHGLDAHVVTLRGSRKKFEL